MVVSILTALTSSPQSARRMVLNWSSCECSSVYDDCQPNTNASGVDFDDAEYGFKEENKDPTKVRLRLL